MNITPIEFLLVVLSTLGSLLLLIILLWIIATTICEYISYIECEMNHISIKINCPIISKEYFEESVK